MKKGILVFISLIFVIIFGIGHSNSESDFFNFAYISGTVFLNFNGQLDGIVYEVRIDQSKYYYYTGNDDKIYHCFEIVGTGYTDTLGEVYFGYEGVKAYECADGKLRGFAKLSAGGRINFEDNKKSEFWKIQINHIFEVSDKYYYFSEDGDGNGKARTFSPGLGFWDWNSVKTTHNARRGIYKFVDTSKSEVIIPQGSVAGTILASDMFVSIKDGNGKNINGLLVKDLSFDGISNTDFKIGSITDPQSGLIFLKTKRSFQQNIEFDDGTQTIKVLGLSPTTGNFNLLFSYDKDEIVNNFSLSGYTSFNSPLTGFFEINDGNGDSKFLIGSQERGKFKLKLDPVFDIKINNISSAININGSDFIYHSVIEDNIYLAPDFAFFNNWMGSFEHNKDFFIKIKPTSDNVDNYVEAFYEVEGNYDIRVGAQIYNNIPFKIKSNHVILYPDKKIELINMLPYMCLNKKADGRDFCYLQMEFKNNKGYNIPNLQYNLNIQDSNMFETDKSMTFDINETTAVYDSGLFVGGYNDHTNKYGKAQLWLYSFKPISNGKFNIKLTGIKNYYAELYNWIQSDYEQNKYDLKFDKVVDLGFSGINMENGVAMNANNEITIIYKDLLGNGHVSEGKFQLKGSIMGCSGCVLTDSPSDQTEVSKCYNDYSICSKNGGEAIVGNNFGSEIIKIYISGTSIAEKVVYENDWYSYELDGGSNGIKTVKLKPNNAINGNSLTVLGQFFGVKLDGMVNEGYNYLQLSQVIENVGIIGSTLSFSKFTSDLKNDIYRESRGVNKQVFTSNTTFTSFDNLGKNFYSCDNGVIVYIGDGEGYNDVNIQGHNELYFLNCSIHVRKNILRAKNSDKLEIFVYTDEASYIENNTNGRELINNIYIYPKVKTIVADLTTMGSIFCLNNSSVNEANLFPSMRWKNNGLKNQLFIKGKLMSRNTMGGGFLSGDVYVLPGGRKYDKTEYIFDQSFIKTQDIAQAYDVNFWRASYVTNPKYDSGFISPYIKSKYNCLGLISDNRMCLMPVVLEYDG